MVRLASRRALHRHLAGTDHRKKTARNCHVSFRRRVLLACEEAEMNANSQSSCNIVILGGGYAGLMAALSLRARGRNQRVVLVNAVDEFVERVRLQEAIARPIAARIPSLSQLLAGSGIEFVL